LPHGYTNQTRIVGAAVEKSYEEPHADRHARTELACLDALRGVLPVPVVLDADGSVPRLRMTLLSGAHGQDLVDGGHAAEVLRLIGHALATLQQVPPETVPGLGGDGPVIVHGDFGPQNMLFDLARERVTGIVDWEFAHRGDAIEDLAWCEWIVRMHHPNAVDVLDELFAATQQRPPWHARHEAMIERVRALVTLAGPASHWPTRLDVTAAWVE
jgi:Ser/Thr protein kinase RdoA (MazF antagonist)